ncbi:hypothetical protein GDO81_012280 [Engystomops pustulosus]|uniref:Uncharacterized protein n=1 Tax=Engystomops pustulosus TaxID=76066 RepID=A0AAV7BKQ9_ENGPU|nr:hypothetical protein GDO81_012280 [Engystomops pustulosus]
MMVSCSQGLGYDHYYNQPIVSHSLEPPHQQHSQEKADYSTNTPDSNLDWGAIICLIAGLCLPMATPQTTFPALFSTIGCSLQDNGREEM